MGRFSLAAVALATLALAAVASIHAAAADPQEVTASALESHQPRHLLSDHDDDGHDSDDGHDGFDDDDDGIYYGGKVVSVHTVTTGYIHKYNATYDCYTYDADAVVYTYGDDDDGLGHDDDGLDHDDDGLDHDDDGLDHDDDGRKLLTHHKWTYTLIPACPGDYTYAKGSGVHAVFYASDDGAVYYGKDDKKTVYYADGSDDDGHGSDDDGHGSDDDGHVKVPAHRNDDDGHDDDGHVQVPAKKVPKKVYAGDDDGGDDRRRRILGSRAMMARK